MNKDTFIEKIKEIGSLDDTVEIRSRLTEISEEVSKIYDNNELLNTTIGSLNDSLAKTNKDLEFAQMENKKLWLKFGTEKSEEEVMEDSTGIKKEEKKVYKNYDELAQEFFKK